MRTPLEDLYFQNFNFVADLIPQSLNGNIDIVSVQNRITALIDSVSEKHEDFLRLIIDNHSPENYLVSHCLNSTILSLLMGAGLHYPLDDLEKLGMAALFHDIGMVKHLETIRQPVKLSPEDFKEVQTHPAFAVKMLERIPGIGPEITRCVEEHHERDDGTGYPKGLKEGQIHKISSIIAVADVYQALIHARPYREKYLPFQAIKEMVQSRNLFNRQALKGLLEIVSLFPVGTLVELDSRVIARVVKVNRGSLMSPDVEVLYDANKLPGSGMIISLSNNAFLNIKRCLTEEEMKELLTSKRKSNDAEE